MSRFKSTGWKTPSPSRGNTTSSIRGKISGPIPITDDDDEFPIRSAGVSMATPLGHEGIEKQLALSPQRPLRETSPNPEEEQVISDPVEPTRDAPEVPPIHRLSYEIPARQTTEINLGLVADMRGSTFTPASTPERPGRKKSTLRSVLGRLFGKKRKSGGEVSNKIVGSRHGQHHSDPTALRSLKEESLQQRSASMPINEFNRALRSHSIIADENMITEQDRNTTGLAERRTRPRRATTPSRRYTPTGGPGKDLGLAPRPASGHVRTSQSFDNGPIGYAVTSGSHPNRRSRSLEHFQAIFGSGTEIRRRSDEIKYWRESYDIRSDLDAMSPLSSSKPEGEPQVLADDNEMMPEPEPQPPPQPFNFGPLGELAGMKITQAASLETRVSRLEERLQKMERVVSILHSQAADGHMVLQAPPKGNSKHKSWSRPGTDSSEMSLPQHPPNAQMYQQIHNPQADTAFVNLEAKRSHESNRPSTTSTQRSYHQSCEELSPRPNYTSSLEQTPRIPSNANLSVSNSDTIARPLSTSTTIRGIATSSPDHPPFPLSKHGSLTAHHYSALLNLIQAESTARKHLEAQVLTLQNQLHAALSGSAVPYPTPSPDRRGSTDRGRMTQAEKARAMGLGMEGEFSTFEHEGSDSESEYEPTKEEEFMTLHEERAQYEAQEDYEREMGRVEGGQPRTLSLSQMTLGKSHSQSVNF